MTCHLRSRFTFHILLFTLAMPAEAATEPPVTEQPFFAQGIPVEVGKIQRELKKLWQDSHETATRASRLNLVIFSDAEHSLRANTALVERITRQHALRAILIAAKPHKPETRVRAWVNAHCQISRSGQKQRCSEQIAFQLEGDAWKQGLVPNLVFSNLDSDLPLYLWRQGEFSDTPAKRSWPGWTASSTTAPSGPGPLRSWPSSTNSPPPPTSRTPSPT